MNTRTCLGVNFSVYGRRPLDDQRRHRRSTGDYQDPRSSGLAPKSPSPFAGKSLPSPSDGLNPPETQIKPLPSRSIPEPTVHFARYTPQTSHGVAIVGNILCRTVGYALLVACPPPFRPLTGVIDSPPPLRYSSDVQNSF